MLYFSVLSMPVNRSVFLFCLLLLSTLSAYEAFSIKPTHQVCCRLKLNLKKVSWIKDYENITKDHLIKSNIDLVIDKKINNELSFILENKFTSLENSQKLNNQVLSSEFTNKLNSLENSQKTLEKSVAPLTIIYTILVALAGAIGTLIFMAITKLNFNFSN